MATSRFSALNVRARSLRLTAVAAIAAATVVINPALAGATPADTSPAGPAGPAVGQDAAHAVVAPPPRTSAEAGAQIQQLNRQLEVITERYNTAGVVLGHDRAKAAAAQRSLDVVQRQLQVLQGQVRGIAMTAYQNGEFSSFSSFMGSKSPQGFLDQLSALDVISKKQATVLTELSKAKATAQHARTTAATALAAAQRTSAELSQQKVTITQRLGTLNTLMSRLSASELAALRKRTDAQQPPTTTPPSDPPGTTPPTTPPGAPAPPVSASGGAAKAVAAAQTKLGDAYVWAAAGPTTFDCSGLTMWAWAQAGVSLPHSSQMQSQMGQFVPHDQLQPGDLVFYYSPVSHVAIYVGGGEVIQAPETGDVVKYSPVDSMPYNHAQRVG